MVRKAASGQRGFTLIELIIVVTIVGILAGIAMVQVRNMQRKAREAALVSNLHELRKALDNFYADKQRYPSNLEELVPNYIRRVPPDPITQQTDWEEIVETPDPDAPQETDEFGSPAQAGVSDVKSRATGTTLDGREYSEL
ncbi:MAG TPA: prepilin-type N-terminal cleavage/methylation domain-containing protein, partial [Thermoanaerobaculia bacterium]|nr:prepilin-type N-terminal cleavage/methylation domain-containing protein [Thermoanaerobaculia bacterium]